MPYIQLQFRRGTGSEWTSANPILANGEMGVDTDNEGFKIGNGIDGWVDLPYANLVATGPTGPSGPFGPTGVTGSTGPQGDTGATGPQGLQGPTGPQGIQGVQGEQGNLGPQGDIGPTGPQGVQGEQGNLGPQGDIGPTGPQGVQGEQGNVGPEGDQGTTGPTGPSGPTGPTGPQGATGPAGYVGLDGNTGPTGPQGNTGPTGVAIVNLNNVKTYSQKIIENAVTANSSSYTVLETYTIPSGAKGKNTIVYAYMHLYNQVVWATSSTIQYGYAVDGTMSTAVALLDNKYYHLTNSNNYLIGNYGGTNTSSRGGMDRPINFPLYISPTATNLQAVVRQSSNDLLTSQIGSVTTTTFTSTGAIQTFTVPSGVSALTIHLWGSGGSYWRAAPTGAYGGGGAYVSGTISTSPGTVYYIIVGNRNGTTTLVNGNGGVGGEGTNGGGFTGIFNANVTSYTNTQAAAALIACAGGGGAGGLNSQNRGGGGGVTNGLNAVSGGAGGTQTAGGGGAFSGTIMAGGGSGSIGGGGGGGYYGGGSGSGYNGSGAGGGGSSYIGTLSSVVSADGQTPATYITTAECGRSDIMTSFFGSSATYGFTHNAGAAVIVTQGTYPTYIGSELSIVY